MNKKMAVQRYFNRELSWIEFNRRVLAQAQDSRLPLLSRLKFLAIVASNFDEFFMVRVATVRRQVKLGNYTTCPSGLSPSQQLTEIFKRTSQIVADQYQVLADDLIPGLREAGIALKCPADFSDADKNHLRDHFQRELLPILTPVRFDPTEAYINFNNHRLHIAFKLRRQPVNGQPSSETERVAVVQIPSGVGRIMYLPDARHLLSFTFVEFAVIEYAADLFPGYDIVEHLVFRVTRDADFSVNENPDEGFVQAMEQVLHDRDRSSIVALSASNTGPDLLKTLRTILKLDANQVFVLPKVLDLAGLMEVAFAKGFDHLREEPWKPVDSIQFPENQPIVDAIRQSDRLLSLPYESFEPVVRFLNEAADDPQTLAIKMTLYRTSGDSPLVQALERAARNGKHVTVLVEIKARFDEERNIAWAERLSAAGGIVVYGIVGLKVHAKALMIIRREEQGMRRYLHLSTGNYNDRTAKIYSDLCLFTCREDLAYEAGLFFNAITGYSAIPVLNKLSMAPNTFKPRLLQLIQREIQKTSPERPGLIIAKINALVDPDIIEALYEASQAGVRVSLNIRGICMLVPGLPGISENIEVTSIVDRFLEHSRIAYFQNAGQEEIYLSSADWMPRNLEGRVELLFPIDDAKLKAEVKEMLQIYQADNSQAWGLDSEGRYTPIRPNEGEKAVSAQEALYRWSLTQNTVKSTQNKKEFNVRRRPPKL